MTNDNYRFKNLRDFQNIHAGQRCFVIGNGPSLNKIDMSLLRSEITFGSNRVYHGFQNWGFGFTYWSIEDMLVAEDIAAEWTREMISSPRYPSTVFVPQDLMQHVEAHVEIFSNPCVPVNFARREFYPNLYPFSVDPAEIAWGGTVTYLLLQLAAIMGCNPIILIGVDFNYVIPRTATRLDQFDLLSNEDDPNHFFPAYFGKGRKWHDPMLPRMRVGYLSAWTAARDYGFKIYNATSGTKLDVFTCVNYYRALKGDYRPDSRFEKVHVLIANLSEAEVRRLSAKIRGIVRRVLS